MGLYLLYYLALINILAFFVVGWDKFKAIKKKQRISERGLFNIAGLGGSLGFWMGMFIFRHKTKKFKFSLGIPLLLSIQGFMLLKYYAII